VRFNPLPGRAHTQAARRRRHPDRPRPGLRAACARNVGRARFFAPVEALHADVDRILTALSARAASSSPGDH
jgi:hypothetical protein